MGSFMKTILGMGEDTSFADDPRPLADPIGDLFFKQQFGVPRPGAAPEALTVEQTAAALEKLRAKLGDTAFAKKMRPRLTVLREGAEEYLSDDSFATQFLRAAVAGDDTGMRAAVKKFVRENQAELLSQPTN
jgi:hypothetical protein